MKIVNDFDCENFADYARGEAEKYLPADMKESDKTFILDMFRGFALRSGMVLSQDMSLKLGSEKQIIERARHILEWVFKAAVALVESGIPDVCRHGFMLDVGYVAFEVTKEINNLEGISDEQVDATVEYHVMNKIKKMLAELQLARVITPGMKDAFLNHEYIDKSKKNIEFAIYG